MTESLRDRIGQAIATAIQNGAPEPDWNDSREIDRLADAALGVINAAASEPLGYMDPAASFMMPVAGSCVLSANITLVQKPDDKYTAPVFWRPPAMVHPYYKTLANEYADAATNGLQWLRNLKAGYSTADEALAEMEANLKRIRNLPAPK